MKNLKKLFSALLMTAAAFTFFSCNMDTEEDEGLTVSFTVSDTEYEKAKKVKMTASSEKSAGSKVYILYTLDGDEPKVDFAKKSDGTKYGKADLLGKTDPKDVLDLLDYGTACLIESGDSFYVFESAIIKAKAFYIVLTDTAPLKTGRNASKEITIAPDTNEVTDASAPQIGNLYFHLATSGNSNLTHYFDTSNQPFKYTFAGKSYDHCYYQFQFSWTGSGKGNWFLFVRQLGKSLPIGYVSSDGSYKTNFLAKGTYVSNCFNASNGSVANGDLTLKTLAGNIFGSTEVEGTTSSPYFGMNIEIDIASKTGNVYQAIEDAK